MKEKLVNKLISDLSSEFCADDLLKIKESVIVALDDFDVKERSTQLVVYEDIPECVKMYLVTRKIDGLSDGTLKNYALRLKEFFQYVRLPINKISSSDITVFLYRIQKDRGIGNRTLDGIRTCVCTFFKWAAANGHIEKDPTITISKIKYEKKRRGHLDEEQIEALRDACSNKRDRAILETLFSTGCRVSELVGMSIEDVDLNNKEILVTGKGNKQRVVYINPKAKRAISNYLKTRTDDNPALFVGLRKPYAILQKAGVEKIIKNLGKSAGFSQRIYPHLLRHSQATSLLDRGMDITAIQKILGHADVSTTMIYADVNSSNVKSEYFKRAV